MKKNNIGIEMLAFIVINSTILLYYNVSNTIAAVIFIIASILIPSMYVKKFKSFLNSKVIFSFIFYFTIGLSMLRLHQYQIEWKYLTFGILEISYFAFMFGYRFNGKSNNLLVEKEESEIEYKKIKFIMNSIFYLSLISFIIEFIIRGYLPIFQKNMSAYQDFSVTGIHYFTVSCALYLPLAYYFKKHYKINKSEKYKLLLKSVITILIPIVIVSRQLLLMEFILTFFVMLKFINKKNMGLIIIFIILIAFLWFFVGKFRNQDDKYIKNALKIQDDTVLSVPLMNTYMYLSFNYDNFNANVDNLENYTYGYKSLFPLFALTGSKFILNNYINTNYIRVIDVYTTYPIQMTPYSDFGVIGVIVYMFIIGMICRKIEKRHNNPVNMMYKCLIWYCLLFSFFESFFSNPTIIFMFIFIFMLSKIKVGDKNEESYCINVNI